MMTIVAATPTADSILLLAAKYLNENHPPRTIVGKDYEWDAQTISSGGDLAPPVIQKVHGDEAAWWRDGSVAYGPFYCDREIEIWKKAKKEAWKHMLETSNSISTSETTDQDNFMEENETNLPYLEAVRKVEEEARVLYGTDNESVVSLSSEEFVWMMAIDGCFLLQVALLVLDGGSNKLDHLHESLRILFGEPAATMDKILSTIRIAVSSMFVVGNQIPLVVLKALMKQRFFTDVVEKGVWKQPLDVERLVLFELLLAPVLNKKERAARILDAKWRPKYQSFKRRHFFCKPTFIVWFLNVLVEFIVVFIVGFFDKIVINIVLTRMLKKKLGSESSKDLLHGLWLLMIDGLSDKCSKEDDDDFVVDSEEHDRQYCSYNVVLPTVRSASELKELGIDFWYQAGTSIDRIRLMKNITNSFVVLPRIVIDSDMEIHMLFRNLIQYEEMHFRRSRRKVTEYLQLMREMIRSPDDVKVLAAYGIIVIDPNLEDKVPLIFQELPIPRMMRNHRSHKMRSVRDELNSYTHASTFKKLRGVLNIVVLLALIQTVYTVLSFYKKRS